MNLKIVLLLTFVCVFVYGNSLKNGFVLDDKALIVYNPEITSSKFLPQLFTKGIFDNFFAGRKTIVDQPYRPLQMVSYALDYKIWGMNSNGFHLTNTLLHLGNSVLVFLLLSLLFKNTLLAASASALFLVHPINTSTVAYISGRAELLGAFFMLLGLLSFAKFLRYRKHAYLIAGFLTLPLALFSRESSLIMPLFVAAVLFMMRVNLREYLLVLPFLFLDLAYVVLRYAILGQAGIYMHPFILSMPLRAVNFLNCLAHYIMILILPQDLHLQRVVPFILNILSLRSMLIILSSIGLIFALFRFRKHKPLLFAIAWFLIGFIPLFLYLDGYPLLGGAMMAESWAYLSLIGFSVSLVSALLSLKKMGAVLIACLLAFYGILTIANNFYWKNDLVLLKRTLFYTCGMNPLRRNLINEYLYYGLYNEAKAEIETYALYYPKTPELNELWGNFYTSTKNFPEAVAYYSQALKKINNFFLFYELSLCLKLMNEPDQAIDAGKRSFALNPRFVLNLIQLGDLYTQKKQPDEARRYYRLALKINPHNQALKEFLDNAK